MATTASGLLAGWRRRDTDHCLVVTLQIIEGDQPIGTPEYGKILLAVGDQQLCSLIRDLARAAKDRDLDVWPIDSRPGLLGGVDRLIARLTGRAEPQATRRRKKPMLLPYYAMSEPSASNDMSNAAAASRA